MERGSDMWRRDNSSMSLGSSKGQDSMKHRSSRPMIAVSFGPWSLLRVGGMTTLGVAAFGAAVACSEPVSSSTTSSALFPDEPTSSDEHTPPDAGEENSDSTQLPSSSVAPSASHFLPDANVAASSTDTISAPPMDGGGDALADADAQRPEPPTPVDAQTCGIPVDNGPPLCDPVAQCGCDATQTCAFTPERSRMFTCVAPGVTPIGEPCDADDTCVKGSVCAGGLCAATCSRDADCDDGKCAPVSAGGELVSDLRVCDLACNPLVPDSCATGATCANATGTGTFSCRRQNATGVLDDPCTESGDCAPGLGCAPDGTCRPWCSLETVSVDPVSVAVEIVVGLDAGADVTVCPDLSECLPFSPSAGLGLCGATCPVPDVPGSECSVVAGCGCDNGETCQVELTGRTACNTPGNQSTMGWCNTNTDCGAGLSCLGSLCRPVCDQALLACVDGSVCAKTIAAESSPAGCLGHCDPVTPTLDDSEFTPCGSGAYCSPGLPDNENVSLPESHCTRQSDTPVNDGSGCGADFECRNGSGCDPKTRTCQNWCRETSDCNANYVCELNISPERTGASDDALGFCRIAN